MQDPPRPDTNNVPVIPPKDESPTKPEDKMVTDPPSDTTTQPKDKVSKSSTSDPDNGLPVGASNQDTNKRWENQESSRRWEAQVRRLQQQVDQLTHDKKHLERDVAQRHKSTYELQRQLRETREQQQRATQAYSQQLRTARDEMLSWKARAEGTTNQLQAIQSTQKTTQELLDIRTNELNHAQTFLSKADNVSHAQVLGMVENLNTLGFQLAALLTDNTPFRAERPAGISQVKAGVEPLLGKEMTEILVRDPHHEDPINVQTALQAMISGFASHIITSWDLNFDPARNDLLRNIHNKLFEIGQFFLRARRLKDL